MPDTFLLSFDRATRLSRAAVRTLVLRAIGELRDGINEAEVAAAIGQRSPLPIFESAAWVTFGATLAEIFGIGDDEPLSRTMRAAIRAAVAHAPGVDPSAFAFAPAFALSDEWLGLHVDRFVSRFVEQTRQGVRSIVKIASSRVVAAGRGARNLLRLKSFGLDNRTSVSLVNFASVAFADETISKVERSRMISRRFDVLRRRRARLNALHQPFDAGSAAVRIAWGEGVRQGLISGGVHELQWVTRITGVCPRCKAMSGKRVAIVGGTFASRVVVGAGAFDGTIIQAFRPPLHPL